MKYKPILLEKAEEKTFPVLQAVLAHHLTTENRNYPELVNSHLKLPCHPDTANTLSTHQMLTLGTSRTNTLSCSEELGSIPG